MFLGYQVVEAVQRPRYNDQQYKDRPGYETRSGDHT